MLVATEMLFSPYKVAFLILWFYLCMYLLQRFEFSPLISPKIKPWTNVLMLFAAPFVLILVFTHAVFKKVEQSGVSISYAFSTTFSHAINAIKNTRLAGARGSSSIILLDPSGKSINELYGSLSKDDNTREIVAVAERLIGDAVDLLASDILINPTENFEYDIRVRIDGTLQPYKKISSNLCGAMVNSIKAISGMDISEKRRPQDGAFVAKVPDGTISFRVASAGILHGEKLSIRILNQKLAPQTLPEIGMEEHTCRMVRDLLGKDSGMILLCGPTGSGKSTTLYAMLREIDFYTRNVITIEDPVEYVLNGAGQIEVNAKADITFAKALRSVLRQDPDIICVGEIRDEETASIALKASQTGHLVIATLHSSSNSATLVRLLDLGISPLLMASGLNLVISQRLVRKLCENCKAIASLSDAQIKALRQKNIDPADIYAPVGCNKCSGTGYKGRIGIFDPMVIDNEVKQKISEGKITVASTTKDDEQMRNNLQKQAMKLVIAGVTSLDEIKKISSQG